MESASRLQQDAALDAVIEKTRTEARRLSRKVAVGGALRGARAQSVFEVESPADLSVIGEAPRCAAEDVDWAVNAAEQAFAKWRRIPALERGKYLSRVADALERCSEDLARLVCLETGNALSTQARPEVSVMLELFRLYAGLASELKGRTLPWEPGQLCYTTREPLGVVGAIIPWNAPLFLTAAKIGPALVAGNTVVLKTAEQAPLAVLRCMEIIHEVLPPGVVNCISGFGEEAGKPLAEHPLVRKVTFTGSCEVGRKIMHYAADKICPVTLELGGKSPNILLPDADLELAVPGIATGMRFTRQGQSCSAGSRVLVHERIYDEVVERLGALLGQLRIGNPMAEDTQVGAIISREQFERVNSFIDLARKTPGARILYGGDRPKDPQLQKGYFLTPTIIDNVPGDSELCQQEIFGPVAVLSRWTDFDDMLRQANATQYGLAAAIWTRDLARAMAFVDRIQAGFVQVNQFITPRATLSYGGLKMSGLGKENTLESMLEHFTTSRTVLINPGTPAAL